jgi:hypothetical protein
MEAFSTFFDKQFGTFEKIVSHFNGAGFPGTCVL